MPVALRTALEHVDHQMHDLVAPAYLQEEVIYPSVSTCGPET